MAACAKRAFVADLEKRHRRRLLRFFASRWRPGAADVEDLVQEVFLHLLRINCHESIRSAESYLYAVAFNVLHRHLLRQSVVPQAVELTAVSEEMDTAPQGDPVAQAELQQQLQRLQSALRQLPAKAQAVLLLHRLAGYSLDEIGTRLGFSRANAAKYLGKALFHCRGKDSRVGAFNS